MAGGGAWTDEDVLRESERWVHVPRGATCLEDEQLGSGPRPRLPRLGTAAGISAGLARDAEVPQKAHLVDFEVFLKPLLSEEEISGYAGETEELERRQRGEPPGAGSLVLRFVAYMDTERETRDGREIIAGAGAEVVGETVRLWGAGTLEGFRGQGAYRNLVVERCRVAHARGATLALTKANTGTSGPTLRRAGFRFVDTECRHVLTLR